VGLRRITSYVGKLCLILELLSRKHSELEIHGKTKEKNRFKIFSLLWKTSVKVLL